MYGTTPYFVGETAMLEACEYVCMEKIPQILFTEGNGEPTGADSPLVEAFGTGNRVDLSKIDSLTWKDASCLVINTPAEDFNDSETKIVLDFLKSGGRLLVITNEENLTMPNLCKILSTYGLSSKGGVVYDGEGDEKTDSVEVVINYDHDSMVAAQQAGLVPEITGANPITLFTSADGALITVPLLMTSENSYVGEDIAGKGIKVVAAAAEEAVGKETVRIAWFTGADSFNSSELDGSVAESNVYTLFCAMNWLNRAYDSQVPSEIPVLYDQGALNVSSGGAIAVAIVFVLILPASFVAISAVSRNKRKNRK